MPKCPLEGRRISSRSFRIEPIEETLYEQVAAEIVAGQIKQGLWLKATVESDGDDFRARTIYTKFRVEQLKAELPKPSAAEATMKARSEEKLRREQQEEATQWREKNPTRGGYTPQEQTRMNKQITVALVIIVLLFVLLLGASLVVLN